MLLTLIQKEMMHHILSVRFIVLLLMCLLLIPLTLSMNYQHYRQNLVDYQEAVKLANAEETEVNTNMGLDPELEVSKLFLKPTPLSVFATWIRRRTSELSRHDTQWHYSRAFCPCFYFAFLSLRTS